MKLTYLAIESLDKLQKQIVDSANDIGQLLLYLGGGLAVLFLIIGGIRYIVAAGNEEQIKAAKNTIIYAIVGLILIVISIVIVNTLPAIFPNTMPPSEQPKF